MILQRNNRKRTHTQDAKSFADKMTELGFPRESWQSNAIGIDLDRGLYGVFTEQLHFRVQFDPMHLARAM